MKKVVVISALCMSGVGLMAFKPFKVHTVPLNDVTAAYNAGELSNLMENTSFSDYDDCEYVYSENTLVKWSKHYDPEKKKSSPSRVDKVEEVLKKY